MWFKSRRPFSNPRWCSAALMKTTWSRPRQPPGTERMREGCRQEKESEWGVLENISWVFPGENSLIRGGGRCGCCTVFVVFNPCVSLKKVCVNKSLWWVQCGNVKRNNSRNFYNRCTQIFQYEGMRLCTSSRSEHILNRKTDFDRCPVSHSPCCCCYFSPLRTFKDCNRQKEPKSILVKNPCVSEQAWEALQSTWNAFSKPQNLESWQTSSVEKFWKIVEVGPGSRIVLTPGQNLQIKHLDRVWNFKWKLCRQSTRETIIKITWTCRRF